MWDVAAEHTIEDSSLKKRGNGKSQHKMTVKKAPISYVSYVTKRRRARGFFRKDVVIAIVIFFVTIYVTISLLDGAVHHSRTVSKEKNIKSSILLSPRQTLEATCCHCCEHSECSINLNGDFVGDFEQDLHFEHQLCLSSFDVIRAMMERIEKGLSFAWIRWGDGEMSESVKENDYSKKLKRSLHYLSRNEYSIVNVGIWWLKQDRIARQWNNAVPPQPKVLNIEEDRNIVPIVETRRMIFHNSFYFPIGGPLDAVSNKKGIKGWSHYTDNYKLVLVGPLHLRSVPFLNPSHFVETAGVNRNLEKTSKVIDSCMKLIDEQNLGGIEYKPLMFIIAAGFSTKIIIAELLQYKEKSNNLYTQIFIDIGASLDGYVGVQSRDYNKSIRYCEEVIKNDPKNRYYWMKKGVCEEKFWKELNSTLSG